MSDGAIIMEWAVAEAPLDGVTSGDAYAVVPVEHGALLAVIDGLGHGPEAQEAAQAAVQQVRAHATESIVPLLERCHAALRTTRGAVASLAFLDGDTNAITWTGVGNVECVVAHDVLGGPRNHAFLRTQPGIVGYRLPRLRESSLSVAPGDTLVMVTDGIRSDFNGDIALRGSAQEVADHILAQHGRKTDDALVLVARYKGLSHG